MKFAWGLKNRLLVALLLLSLIPIVVVVVVTTRNYATLVERQVEQVSANILERSMIRLANQLEEISRVSEYIAYQQTAGADPALSFLRQYAKPGGAAAYDRLRHEREFRSSTESLLLSHSYIEGLYLFAEDGTVFSGTKGSELRPGYVYAESDWYRRTLERQGGLFVSEMAQQPFLLSEYPSITFSRALYDPKSKQRIGVLLINCGSGLFEELRNGVLDDQRISVLSAEGGLLYGTASDEAADVPAYGRASDETAAVSAEGQAIDEIVKVSTEGRVSGSLLDERRDRLYVYDTFSAYEWRMVISVSLASVAQQVRSTQTFAIGFGIVWAIVAIALSLWIANAFSKPVSRIALLMKNYDKALSPADDIGAYAARTDEIGILYGQYASMLHKIDTLIHERYSSQLIAMSAKMKALEAQINSHFLFNTLATINSIAELENVASVAEVSKALGNMFRYSIKLGRDEVTLREELAHVADYMLIQSYRYGERIRAEIDIPDELMERRMLKLLLQPIVENAVFHGLEPKKGKGVVRITAGADERGAWIEVADDGVGIAASKLARLHEMLGAPPTFEQLDPQAGDARSIGIYNVHARLSLYYGAPYGVEAHSDGEGRGTRIRLRLPGHEQHRWSVI